MSNHSAVRGETAENIEDIAAAWLWRRADTEWSKEDQDALDAWLAESHNHLAAFWRLEAIWERTRRLKALSAPQIFQDVREGRRRILPLLRAAQVAGAVIVVLIAAIYLWPVSSQVYATDIGRHKAIDLADGSRVELNTNTRIAASVTGRKRTITLENGEAFFQVRHDETRPFEVLVAGRRIVDLGTKFSVRVLDDGLKVTLVEGRARLEAADADIRQRSIELVPGEVVIATANSISVSKETPDVITDALAWKNGLLVFRHITLADAAQEFNRYNKVKLAVGSDIAAKKINGTFASDSVEAFAKMAQVAMDLHVEKSSEQIRLTR